MPYKDPEQSKENKRQYYLSNRERFLEKSREYRAAHLEEIRARDRRRYRDNNERLKEEQREYRRKHPERVRATNRKAQIKSKRKLKRQLIEAYGGKCECCGEIRFEFLSIDHKNGGGNKHRKELNGRFYVWLKQNGFPKDEFRLLCMNCNFARGKYGYCPHSNE